MDVDSETMPEVIRRLRRAQGQVGGVIKMMEEGRDCTDVLTQLAAVSRAIDRASFKIIATGLRQCALDSQAAGGRDNAQLEHLFLALSRAIDRAGSKIIATGLQQYALDSVDGETADEAERAQLERLFRALA